MGAGRPLLVVLVTAALLAMTVHYGAAADAQDPYPTASDLATDYESHVGEEFFMWMTVIGVENGSLVVGDTADPTVVLRAGAPPPDVRVGDVVQVYGVLEPRHRLDRRDVVVSPQDDRAVMFAVSVLAVLLALVAFLREWTVDREQYAFVTRDG